MLLTSLFAKSMAAKIALGVVGASVGATAVAAQAGVLPTPMQQVAHEVAGTVGVPAPSSSPSARMQTETPTTLPSAWPSLSPEASESPEPRGSESPEPNESHKPDCHSGKTVCEWHGKGWQSRSPEADHESTEADHESTEADHESPEPTSHRSATTESHKAGSTGRGSRSGAHD